MTNPIPQAVLFDLDGTLLDTAPDLGAALNQVLASEKRPLVSAEEYTPLASHGSAGLLRYAYGDEFDQRRDELRSAFLSAYAANIAANTKPFHGVRELLQQLQQRSIPVAIVTNKPHALTAQLVPFYQEFAHIQVVISGDTLAVAKPNPEPLLHAANLLRVDASSCWYIGDAERDIEAGRRANMFTVLARYGYISATDQPEIWGANAMIDHPAELLELWSD
ncbi:HAD family hydrolase [Pseudidiomarina woesei]|uniref:2-phosphoglycolate phosphatase, prokaryotic n=1 Tax=Pseudidiomarina woesei TaxID=1381080 RepID=A0A0K6GVJ8_9GAMM|nr:HAD-IA family hydrolase [Pseudidiomarina woesei]CUA82585.1 2-phosphoglycolate phosphatase, prokaryotic [Pseudidiomarina woesei]